MRLSKETAHLYTDKLYKEHLQLKKMKQQLSLLQQEKEDFIKYINRMLKQITLIKTNNYEGIDIKPEYLRGVEDTCKEILSKLKEGDKDVS